MKNYPFLFFAFLISFFANSQNTVNSKNHTSIGSVEIKEKELDLLISTAQAIEVLADGFIWAEGPIWVPHLSGLLFSDVPNNKVYLWTEKEGLQLFLDPSGHTGYAKSSQTKGANGLTLDAKGNLILCQVGDRRIGRLKNWDFKTPIYETIVDRYDSRLFNSPNDLVLTKNQTLYFTDPPYGLKGQDQDDLKELPFNGVYRFTEKEGILLLSSNLKRPNGIALSIDEKILYVANSDIQSPYIYSYEITKNGVKNEKLFFDGSALLKKNVGLFDGLKVHSSGILFATGPGGVLIIDAKGKHLGTIYTDSRTANCAFDLNESYLYMTSHTRLTRIKLK